ncbi:hypothetical protein HRbin01_01276 [archaeon HR01]|nr:hypothetical protein HRbin01_01276 [archaeon HR01]
MAAPGYETITLLGDIWIGLSILLPTIFISRIAVRVRSRIPWQEVEKSSDRFYLLLSWIGFAGYVAVTLTPWLGPVSEVDYLFYSQLTRMITVSALFVLTNRLLRLLQVKYWRVQTAYLIIIVLAPSLAMAYHLVSGNRPIAPPIIIGEILYFGFIFWTLMSYLGLAVMRLTSRMGFRNRLFYAIPAVLNMAVAIVFIYAVSSYLYGVITAETRLIYRGTSTALGSISGASLLLGLLSDRPRPPRRPTSLLLTGLKPVDEYTNGGIPYPSLTLVEGGSGSGKSTVANMLTATRLLEDDVVIRFCLDYHPNIVRVGLLGAGIDPKKYEEASKLIMVDGFTVLSGERTTEKYATSRDLNDILITLTSLLNQFKGQRIWVVIDSISQLLTESGQERFLKFIRILSSKCTVAGAGLIVTHNPLSTTPIVNALLEEIFHNILELKVRGGTRLVKIVKMPHVQLDERWMKYET